MTKKTKSSGPKPDRLHIAGAWVDAVSKAINKNRPLEGWPEPEKKGKKKKD